MNFIYALLVGFFTTWTGRYFGLSATSEDQLSKTVFGVGLGAFTSTSLFFGFFVFGDAVKDFGLRECGFVGGAVILVTVVCSLLAYFVGSSIPSPAEARVTTPALIAGLVAAIAAWIMPIFLVFGIVAAYA
jgi:hypothetical protein